ncbi:hypothetical protein GCM10025857_19500 [Alicyclobacillus contaminans]|nr:hypothetical protein GCM10025857_19500 [Alicyclobacillus contaminans]
MLALPRFGGSVRSHLTLRNLRDTTAIRSRRASDFGRNAKPALRPILCVQREDLSALQSVHVEQGT